MKGIEVNDFTLALDEIDKSGPSGEHVTSMHTYKNFKKEQWFPTLMNRMRYSEWKTMGGASTMEDRIKEKARKILRETEVPALPESMLKAIDAVVQRAEDREAKKKK